MEKKVGLNNVQRKMLDEIYSEQFEKKARIILGKRETEYKKLQDRVITEEGKKSPLKEVIAAIDLAFKLVEKNTEYLKINGLGLSRIEESELHIDRYGSYTHPRLEEYRVETQKIEQELAQKKKEIRARIYGMDTTYKEVESEISKYIADIKI